MSQNLKGTEKEQKCNGMAEWETGSCGKGRQTKMEKSSVKLYKSVLKCTKYLCSICKLKQGKHNSLAVSTMTLKAEDCIFKTWTCFAPKKHLCSSSQVHNFRSGKRLKDHLLCASFQHFIHKIQYIDMYSTEHFTLQTSSIYSFGM